ncbi:hypothetical protein Cgig2_004840 [Carnegiea gigantea]|uniref:Uncharacterized protein n=1 Tax=Carnegiea gigantea TaxID=171969 RepID=A0A9Q1KVM2_9CARY|nr:hypothetical protein Cgig2_004840 [Carnegiea gigantea]
MAGAIVEAAAQWIGNLMIQEVATLFEVEDQVRGLQEDLESMQQYLHDADAKQEVGEIRVLVNQIRELAYEAEDVIDTYIIRVEAKVEWSDRSWWPSRLIRSVRFMYKVPHMYRIGKHIQVIQSRLKRVTDKFNTCGVIRIAELAERSRLSRDESYRRQRAPRTYPFDDNENEYVVGREKDMSELIEVLMGEGNDQKTYLSIVGMGGSGKTTLAKKLYNHPYTAGCFDRKAWVFISQEWSTRHVLSQVLRMVSGRTSNLRASVDELVEKLHHFLENKSYLVVLDDVWKIEALQEILPALPRGTSNRGSKIIITTRNRDVTRFQILEQKQHIHEPKPLTEEEAGQLFHKFTLSHRQTYNMKSFENLGKEMLKKCDGLPLAIVALCGILNTKDSIREWQQVKESVLARVMEHEDIQVNGRVGDLLALSYDDLPYDLKPCFLYLGIFPEDCQIPAGMLTRMWIAEGLVTAHGGMSLEDVAMQRLKELSHRFMVQVVRVNFKGEIKAVRLHDLLRDLCVRKANEQSFLEIYAPANDPDFKFVSLLETRQRRAALHSSVNLPTQASRLRSLVVLTRSSVSNSAYSSKESLELETSDCTLPSGIGNLIHLRYLGIRASNITELPKSIGNLRNLLTLDYRNVNSDGDVTIKIPNIFGKLVLLRHLFLPVECPWCTIEGLELSALKNLQILWGVRQDGGADWLFRELPKLSVTIEKLMIVVSTKRDLDAAFHCPSLLSGGLHTLHCELRSEIGLRLVEPISHCEQLYKLILTGAIQMDLALTLPSNLFMLELKDCMLGDEDPMEAIGALRHLKLLRLSNSCLVSKLVCKSGSFPQLEELYLENFANLEMWTIQEGSLLNLKKLEILACHELRHFPKGLLFVTTLQQLEFLGVPDEFDQVARDYGWWSQKKLRLPHNYEAIMQRCDSAVSLSSIENLYKELSTGKYWVMKQEDRYYNCFILYAKNLNLSVDFDDDWLMDCYHPSVLVGNYWEWIETEESSDGISITVTMHTSRSNNKPGRLLQDLHTNFDPSLPEMKEHTLKSMPRGEWIRLPVRQFQVSDHIREISFALHKVVPGVIVKGVTIEPML